MEPYKETIDTVVSEFDADLADGLTEDKVQEQIKNNGKINLMKRQRNP